MASKNSKGESYGKGRTRNFATAVYPESAPDGWLDVLTEMFIPAFISPLHDMDVNPDGEIKKPHYHVMLMFDNVKTDEQAKEVFDSIGGVGLERVNSTRGYARYLCHLDNPEKHQYPTDGVRCLSGADYLSVIGLPTDRLKVIGEMMDFCDETGLESFSKLSRYAKANRPDWYRSLTTDCGYFMGKYLKSVTWTRLQEQQR